MRMRTILRTCPQISWGVGQHSCTVGVSMSSSDRSDEEEQTDRQIYYVISDYTAVEDSQVSQRTFSLEWKYV